MKSIAFLISTTFLFFLHSCGSKTNKENAPGEDNPKPEIVQHYSTDTFYLTDDYPEINSTELSGILDSLKFCEITPDLSLPDSLQLYPCSAEYFGIFANSSGGRWQDGFLMEARQGVWAKSSRVFNIEKSEFGYAVTNDLKGQLLYMIPNKSGKSKMVLRYYDSKVGTIGVEHEWKGSAYKPVKVVLVNDFPVKKEFQDSLNHYYLDNFVWGF